jgi:transcriptional regulator with XRE-family HTH domain
VDAKHLIGIRLKELRSRRNLTQEQLAERAGVNSKYINSIERGKENPTLDTFIKLAETLDVTIGEFFRQLEIEDTEKRMSKIKSILDQASPEQQGLILEILSAILE